jgi:hypothetical protein
MIASPHAAETRSLDLRVITWGAAAALVILLLGPMFLKVFRPPTATTYGDFVQEWLSARNFWAGDAIYLPQREAMLRRTGADIPSLEERLAWNAHPPVAVLVALPFGLTADYQAAHFVWNIGTFALFLLGIGIVLRELRIALHWWSIFPFVVLLVANNPVLDHLWWGQINFLVSFLLVAAWAAHRHGYRAWAGVSIGLATAIKLSPGLVLVYFLAAREWRSLAFAVLTIAISNLIAACVFGVDCFGAYITVVLPTLEVFQRSWGNAALSGYWLRVFAAAGAPRVGSACSLVGQVAVAAIVVLVARRSRAREDRDLAFALAVAGIPLAASITWAHHFVILVLPLVLLWHRVPRGWARIGFYAALLLLLMPPGTFPDAYKRLAPGPADTTPLLVHLPAPQDLGLCVVAFGIQTLALSIVFLLLLGLSLGLLREGSTNQHNSEFKNGSNS